MAVAKYRKKPVVVEAIQYRPHDNCAEVAAFLGDHYDADTCSEEANDAPWAVHTLEGPIWASPGDWIIRGVAGEFYPCKPDIFAATYEAAES